MADPRLPDFSEKMRLRRRRSRGRRRRPLLVALGLMLVVVLLTWLIRFSTVFAVTAVEVKGATLVTAAQVRERAGVPTGVPLATVDTAEVARRVSTITAVSRVRVARRWPHTVVITISERTPVYQRVVTGHRYQWVDAQGVIFHETPARSPHLPEVTTAGVDNITLADVATVVTALPPNLLDQVASIEAATRDAIVLRLKDGRRIVWGSADSSALKSQVVLALMHVRASVYDVSSPANPTTR